jgi:glutamate N-acetyltransferase / amino-acid N-acetyltransferase
MDLQISNGSITTPKGFRACGIKCGIKDVKDLAMIVSDVSANVSALYTTNKFPAAPIIASKKNSSNGAAQALVVNSGNANACTGLQGLKDAEEMVSLTASELEIDPGFVLVASTGVIGHAMPMDKIRAGIKTCAKQLSPDGGIDAAEAIRTTDTFAKHFSISFELDGKACSIGGIAKGSGMINPTMATTINVLTTDVDISPELLDLALKESVALSLNSLTVDGTMSTNDCVYLFANGLAGNNHIDSKNKNYCIFLNALKAICIEMAKSLARDGEGATKLVTVCVSKAENTKDAEKAAKEIANAPLVKTAIFGKDPNWGRIFAAVGGCDVLLDPNNTTVKFGDVTVAEKGRAVPYDENKMQQVLNRDEIEIFVSLGVGEKTATVFTCDMTYDYIKINAEYTT